MKRPAKEEIELRRKLHIIRFALEEGLKGTQRVFPNYVNFVCEVFKKGVDQSEKELMQELEFFKDKYIDEDGCHVAVLNLEVMKEHSKTLEDAVNLFHKTLDNDRDLAQSER